MGYIAHRALIVTGWQDDVLAEAHAKAVEIYDRIGRESMPDYHFLAPITKVMEAPINGGGSFAILPDGSKEGWEHSDRSDRARSEFIEWMIAQRGYYLDWAEVRYGGDEPERAELSRSNSTEEER